MYYYNLQARLGPLVRRFHLDFTLVTLVIVPLLPRLRSSADG